MYKSKRMRKSKSIGWKRKLRMQKRKHKKYSRYRIARGGIRL